MFSYLHEIARDERGTACAPGLAVNINLLSTLNVIQQELDASDEFVLCWRRNQVRCTEHQLPDASLRPLLSQRNNTHTSASSQRLKSAALRTYSICCYRPSKNKHYCVLSNTGLSSATATDPYIQYVIIQQWMKSIPKTEFLPL